MNISKARSPQTVAAVKEAASIAQRKSFKPLAIVASTLAITTAAGATIWGLTCKKDEKLDAKAKNNDENKVEINDLMPITTSMVKEVNNDESKKEDMRAINRAQENNQSVPEDLNKLSNNENIILKKISDKVDSEQTKNEFLAAFKYFVKQVKLRDIKKFVISDDPDLNEEFLGPVNTK